MLSSPCGSISSGGAWYVSMETWWVKRRTPDLQHPHLFMGIARFKYLEWSRDHAEAIRTADGEDQEDDVTLLDVKEMAAVLYDEGDGAMLDIVCDLVAGMSDRCGEILTKFYYEEKDLDTILEELPTIGSKNALKTKKYKCMEGLRNAAKEVYHKYLNEE